MIKMEDKKQNPEEQTEDDKNLNKHWTCKKCFGNNGDDNIDDFGICEGCRKKDID